MAKFKIILLTLIIGSCINIAQANTCQKFSKKPNFANSNVRLKKDFPDIFWIIKSKIKRFLGYKPKRIICYTSDVSNIILGVEEIIKDCPTSNSDEKSCSNSVNNIKLISVFTVTENPANDVLTYKYTVSGGKINGNNEKAIWDLSDVAPGIYMITAAVDDGCGFCGRTMTKTVVVKECPDCKIEKKEYK